MKLRPASRGKLLACALAAFLFAVPANAALVQVIVEGTISFTHLFNHDGPDPIYSNEEFREAYGAAVGDTITATFIFDDGTPPSIAPYIDYSMIRSASLMLGDTFYSYTPPPPPANAAIIGPPFFLAVPDHGWTSSDPERSLLRILGSFETDATTPQEVTDAFLNGLVGDRSRLLATGLSNEAATGVLAGIEGEVIVYQNLSYRVSIIPEPHAALLVCLSVCGVLLRRRVMP